MTDNQNPTDENVTSASDEAPVAPAPEDTPLDSEPSIPLEGEPVPEPDEMQGRLDRLGGEPAPVITPEEFARLQRAGQVHIDSSGRVRTTRRRDEEDGGVSLRKRRAWYGWSEHLA